MSIARKWILAATLALGLCGAASAALADDVAARVAPEDAVLGAYWTPERKGRIEMFRADGQVHGRVVWTRSPDFDENNPDPALRGRPIAGIVLLEGFSYDGEGKWVGGTIYSPRHGDRFDAHLWLKDGHLKLRGYLGIPLFGETRTFPRFAPPNVAKAVPDAD